MNPVCYESLFETENRQDFMGYFRRVFRFLADARSFVPASDIYARQIGTQFFLRVAGKDRPLFVRSGKIYGRLGVGRNVFTSSRDEREQ